MSFAEIIEGVGKVGDGLGVAVIAIGFAIAAVFAARDQRAQPPVDVYKNARQRLGRSILLGLEILVASDIIRTVAIAPTLRSAGVLAIIVVIRSVLSLSLQVELEGRWPWHAKEAAVPHGPVGSLGSTTTDARRTEPRS